MNKRQILQFVFSVMLPYLAWSLLITAGITALTVDKFHHYKAFAVLVFIGSIKGLTILASIRIVSRAKHEPITGSKLTIILSGQITAILICVIGICIARPSASISLVLVIVALSLLTVSTLACIYCRRVSKTK